MTKWQKISSFVVALLMILFGFLIMVVGEPAYLIVILIIALIDLVYSVRMLVYYFRMARYMVGGKEILFRGILFLDLSLFILSLSTIPSTYIMLYMVGMLAFTGVVDIMNAMDLRRMQGHWVLQILRGLVCVIGAILCLVKMNTPDMVVTIFCFMLFYNAVMRIINAVRPTEIIAIQ